MYGYSKILLNFILFLIFSTLIASHVINPYERRELTKDSKPRIRSDGTNHMIRSSRGRAYHSNPYNKRCSLNSSPTYSNFHKKRSPNSSLINYNDHKKRSCKPMGPYKRDVLKFKKRHFLGGSPPELNPCGVNCYVKSALHNALWGPPPCEDIPDEPLIHDCGFMYNANLNCDDSDAISMTNNVCI
ncbi:6515_t:CDS:1 [Dentiscutata heterogama]|uniref:6515_t:CDS:1 n=1 Tax=Dentiscutata heterogama TaxID=1316150 RepID=A0ACA9LX97_9GLOM|nr:6515_t:CDS:1 [Dentiscutata heterogama]